MDELIHEVEGDVRRPLQAIARELCVIATLCDALGDVERRDAALTLAADLMRADQG